MLQLKTQIARAQGLQGKFAAAHATLDEVQAAMQPGSLVEVRYLLERGRALNSNGQSERAVLFFSEASALAQRLGADFFTIDALHMLGIAAPPRARSDWNRTAIQLAESSTDARAHGWLATLYNNAGWALFDEQRYDEALDYMQKAVPLRERKGEPEPSRIARWCVARVLRALDRYDEALTILRRLEPLAPDGFVFEELAEDLLALGRAIEAKAYFAKAYDHLREFDWIAQDRARIERLKSLSV